MVEHWTENPGVGGSIPPLSTDGKIPFLTVNRGKSSKSWEYWAQSREVGRAFGASGTVEPRRPVEARRGVSARVSKEYRQTEWDETLVEDCRKIVRLAVAEDLNNSQDWTTLALVPPGGHGKAHVVTRASGVISGLPALRPILDAMGPTIDCQQLVTDGACVEPGQEVLRLEGPPRDLLTSERLILNLLGRLSGVATATRRYVQAIRGSRARIYDTRKTTPGWRRLEKYAVRCGGGSNHRTGLFDGVLIKDNHLACISRQTADEPVALAETVRQVRRSLREAGLTIPEDHFIIEIEVDRLDQFNEVITTGPDIILLDNFSLEDLRQAVAWRNKHAPAVELEASGGIDLDSVAALAETGVERISVGALTRAAAWLDLAMDWHSPPAAVGRHAGC